MTWKDNALRFPIAIRGCCIYKYIYTYYVYATFVYAFFEYFHSNVILKINQFKYSI